MDEVSRFADVELFIRFEFGVVLLDGFVGGVDVEHEGCGLLVTGRVGLGNPTPTSVMSQTENLPKFNCPNYSNNR